MTPLLFMTTVFYLIHAVLAPFDGSESLIVRELTWNYTHINPSCTGAALVNLPCKDIRICNFATASMRMRGRPAICGWVAGKVPKVCCGLPLVLGEKLLRKVEREKARTRACGTKAYFKAVSPTEDRFNEILRSLPPIDVSEPHKFDPPLDLSFVSWFAAVGGRATDEGKYPWMVAVFRGPTFWCGGTLIDRIHILSAAHCFVSSGEEPDPTKYSVRIGSIELDKAVPFKLLKIVVHENYSVRTHYDDIAMLTLEREILLPGVAHICLPDTRLAARDLTGLNVTVLGWGDLSFGGVNTPILHEVENIPVVSDYQCRNVYRPITRDSLPRGLTSDFICAGLDAGGKDACQRDSGGPLMYKNNVENLPDYDRTIPMVLIGIVSFGIQCGEPGYPGVYTRVSSHMDWITKNSAEP